MSDLRGKVVLITGGSGGLGDALGRAFIAAECRVVLVARNESRLKSAAARIGGAAHEVLALRCDVSRREEIRQLALRIAEHWGDVQILINNAGMARAASFSTMADAVWDETLETNLTGAYNCCKAFLPAMLRNRWGRIINIASTAAKIGFSHASAYSASKHGLLGLTRSLALETARAGVTVNAICPGYIDDERTRENVRIMAEQAGKTDEQVLEMFAATAPQKRLIEPGEVAALALLMASEKMAAMTGQAVNIDGGAVMV